MLGTHYEHFVHNWQLVVYAVIAFQFFWEKHKVKATHPALTGLTILCIIFIFCGATRGFMGFDISNYLTYVCNTILLFVSGYFVFTNRISRIVKAVRNGEGR
jgi:hypothetical protein